jgi:hypothetical protein
MYVHGDGSSYDLVKWMQLRGDLQIAWIMFDHVKHVEGWMTFAYYVYDFFCYKAMMIAICDIKYENTKNLCVTWENLNKIMVSNGVPNLNFKGFMAESA